MVLLLAACGGGGGSSANPGGSGSVQAPTVNISAVSPSSPVVGQAVTFTAMGAGNGINYTWDFGDGQSATGASPSHTYGSAGTYKVVVTVTDSSGATATASAQVVVSNAAISANITAITPLSPSVGQTVTLTGAGTGQGALTYAWNFGDGQTGTGATIGHSYTASGSFTVTLTVTDSAGQTATATNGVVVVNTPPAPTPVTATIASIIPASPVVGQTITLTGSGGGGQGALSYAWNFGDGTSGTGTSASHSYAAAGTYTVSFTVTDSTGAATSATQSITVTTTSTATPASAAIASISPTSPSIGQATTFTGTGTGQGGLNYTWDFGDGTGGSGATATHSYTAAGSYSVVLTVVDSTGQRATATSSVTVINAPVAPTATIQAVQRYVQYPTPGNLTYSFLYALSSTIFYGSGTGTGTLSYTWNFGDGNTGTGATPQHTYASPGNYTVSLVVTDSTGASSLPAKTTITVSLPPVPSALTITPETTLTSATNSILLAGYATAAGTTLSYTWNFGDGTPAMTTTASATVAMSPVHSYASPGVYTVSMTVTDVFGQTATATATVSTPYTMIYLAPVGFLSGFGENLLAFDSKNTLLYYTDNNTLKKLDQTGAITFVAGGGITTPTPSVVPNGTGSAAGFNTIQAMTVDSNSGNVYLWDEFGPRQITPAGVVTSFATSIRYPTTSGTTSAGSGLGLAYDSGSDSIYLANGGVIYKITRAGVATIFAGSGQAGTVDGTGTAASFAGLGKITLDTTTGNLYALDGVGVRKITASGVVTTIGPIVDSTGAPVSFSYGGGGQQSGIAYDASTGLLYIGDSIGIYQLNPATGLVKRLVGTPNVTGASVESFNVAGGPMSGTPVEGDITLIGSGKLAFITAVSVKPGFSGQLIELTGF